MKKSCRVQEERGASDRKREAAARGSPSLGPSWDRDVQRARGRSLGRPPRCSPLPEDKGACSLSTRSVIAIAYTPSVSACRRFT
jgi:hypothetical protein